VKGSRPASGPPAGPLQPDVWLCRAVVVALSIIAIGRKRCGCDCASWRAAVCATAIGAFTSFSAAKAGKLT